MVAALIATLALQAPNSLTKAEEKAGWKLLFDGKTTAGWHNFNATGVRPGWQVKDGVLSIVDSAQAGDIVTDEKYEWFDLTLDFNLGKNQNSGIMFHVADSGEAPWHSGPEVQLYDHPAEKGVEISGYLYQLYASTVDATKPAGEWNHLRILVAPKKCETYMNGVKYYEYVLGSADFWDRVAKSKFSKYPEFAKLKEGTIAIQGDHGQVSFRNIKIRRLKG
ncbi:MAG: DUF1080 domain-containing protein [Fimbriimonadales bacterium]